MGCFSCFSISEKEGGANRPNPNRSFFTRVFHQRRGGDAVAMENLGDQDAESVEPKVERQLSIETEDSRQCWIEEKEEDEGEEVQSRFNPVAVLDPPVQEEEKDKEMIPSSSEEDEYYDWESEEEEDDLKDMPPLEEVSDEDYDMAEVAVKSKSNSHIVFGQLRALGVIAAGVCVVERQLSIETEESRHYWIEEKEDKEEEEEQSRLNPLVLEPPVQDTITGETLCDPENPVVLKRMDFPDPVIKIAIEPMTKADIDKMSQGLVKLAQEDPSFHFSRNEETNQTVIKGMGELHS